jgi:hypothetical protein
MPIATNDKGDTVFLDSDGAWKPATLAENPETKQRLAFDGSTWTPLPSKITTGEAVGRGITQGASFGFRDEGQGLIEAGGGGAKDVDALTNLGYLARGAYRRLTGDPEAERRYNEAVERERASTKQIEQERPGAYLGGNVLGAVAMPMGFAARAPTLASRVAAGAKTGAVAGALTGAGEAEGDLGERAKGAAVGGLVGGAAGGVATPVVEGLARGLGAAASYPVSVARGLLTPGAASERAIGRALTQAERSDPTGINRITEAQFRAAPGEAVVGDVLGEPGRKLARSAANISPEAKETMNQALDARGRGQGSRAIQWLDDQFSFPNARTQGEALAATRRSATNQAYEAAERQGAGGLWSPELERLASSQGVAGAMRTAVQTSQDEAVRRGMGGFNPKISFTPDGRIQFNRGPGGVPTYPDLRYWDQVRRELSDAAQKAGRGTEENMRLGGLAAALNTELDRLVPAYQVARRTAAGFFDARDALEAGQNFATQRFGSDEARAALQQMTATERALFRDGYISRLKDVLSATKDNRDITKILGASQEDRDKMVIALGAQRAREFQAMLNVENIMQKLKEAVQGNSTTAAQLIAAGLGGAGAGGYLGFDPSTSGLGSALVAGMKKGADANMARHITRLMMSRDPAVLEAGLRQLARNARNLEILQSVSNAVSRATAQQGAQRIPGRQAGGPVEEDRPYMVGEAGPEVFVPDDPWARAAARTGHRGRREGAGTQFVEGGYGIPAAYRALDEGAKRAFEAGPELTWGADPEAAREAAGTVFKQAIGAVGTPLVGPAQAGATLGAGAIRRAAPAIRSPETPLFDYSRLRDVPNVPQQNLQRYDAPRGVPERTQALASPENVARVNDVVKRGAQQGGIEWYNTDPLRQAFIEARGPEGEAAYRQYLDMVAATSPRSKVSENARNAAYYYGLAQRGEPLPARTGNVLDAPLPSPYGHIAQRLHVQNANNVLNEGGWPVLQNPKPASFVENLAGNQMPVTVDTHNARLWGMTDTKGRPIDKPAKTEYGYMERLQQDEARKLGMTPAQYQASAWIGGGEQTGLKSSADPFLKVLEDRIRFTAERTGETPQQVLQRFLMGQNAPGRQGPLLSVAPPPAPDTSRRD